MPEASERRAEILQKITEVLLQDGLSDLSLRPLAEKVGSSARLLIYHFGSKENLIQAALNEVHARAGKALAELAAREQPADFQASLVMFWNWATQSDNQLYFRLMFEKDGRAMYQPPDAPAEDGGQLWLRMLERVTAHLPQDPSGGRPTLIMAALNGLLQDLFTTNDTSRILAGLDYLVRIVDPDVVSRG